VGLFPMKYPRVPVFPSRLNVVDWLKLEENNAKKLEVWQGNSLCMGGRTVLINSSLSNTATYHMSMFLMSLTTIRRMDKVRRKFFWQGGQLKKIYHLVKWDKVRKSKKKGGLGLKNLRKMNISLLCKWWWMLEKEGLWQEIVRKKYIRQSPICLIKGKNE
jgi:hypothetical protein